MTQKVQGAAAILLATGLLFGCAGLPSARVPVQLSAVAPLDGLPAAQKAQWPGVDWWQRYQDPTLNDLIDKGLAGSPSLSSARARFDTARQSLRLAAAAAGAHLQLSGDFDRQRLSDNGFIPPRLLGFSWYNQADLGLQATYVFDWWGKQRFAVESATDQARAAQADRSAAALALAGSIADTYFGWQADQQRLILALDRERADAASSAISAARVEAQLEAASSLDQAQLSLGAARERIAALEGSARLRIVTLAALIGASVADLPPLTVRELPSFPAALPDDVKLDLLARRADISASRWRVEAAQKNVASARAEFFPDISLNVLAGVSSVDISKLLEYGSRVPQVGAALHLPIFDAGRLKAQYGGAQAALESAISAYQDTVVGAAREVGMQAATLAQIDAQRRERVLQVAAALGIKESQTARVHQGLTDARSELDAEESWTLQRDALMQLTSAALAADIALQGALGGGYEGAPQLAIIHKNAGTP